MSAVIRELENEEHEELIREYLGVNDNEIIEYEHIEGKKYYVTLLIDGDYVRVPESNH